MGKHRGYVERQEHAGNDGNYLKVELTRRIVPCDSNRGGYFLFTPSP